MNARPRTHRSCNVLGALALGAALLSGCATTQRTEAARAAKVAPPTAVTGARAGPEAPVNARAQLLFEDAGKAAEAQAKAKAPDDAALARRYAAARDADARLAEADYNLGVLAEREGKREEAFGFYKSALEKKRSLKPAAEALARLTAAAGDVPSAIAQWSDIAQKFPDDAGSRAQLAELYRVSGDHDRAQDLARQALIRDPKNLAAYKVMLRSDLDRKQFAHAKLVGLRALKLGGRDPELFQALGDAQWAEGQPDKAAAQYQKGVDAQADFVPARLQLAKLALLSEDYGSAARHLEKAVLAGADTADVHLNLGVAYRGQGQVDKAVAEYDAAEKRDSKLAAIWLNRGVVLQNRGAPDQALALYKKYADLSGGELAIPTDAPYHALKHQAEQLVAAQAEAKHAEEQAKALEATSSKATRAAETVPAKGSSAATGEKAPVSKDPL